MTCHAGILGSSGADIGRTQITPSECGTCHIGAPPEGKVIPGFEESRHDCVLLGAFPHAAHCDEDAANKDPTIKAQGCLACHTAVEDGRTYGLQEKFRTDRYQACEDCHGKLGDEWVLRDESNQPDHGKVDSCSACHEFGAGPMKTHRPSDLVRRPRPSAFGLVSHDHPFITKSDGKYKVDASCKECHRAGFDGGLPSRIGHKKFSHDTHLPATPTPADCAKCHGDVATAKDPAALKLYKLDACAECHKGGKITEIFPEEPTVARPVPRFPHAVHLTPAAMKHPEIASQGCLACHQPAQNGATGVGTLETALDCSKCHDHGENPDLCAGKDRAYVASCAKCHGPDGPTGQPVIDSRLHTASLTGAQWHPTPDQRACSECHLPGASLFRLQGKVNVHAIMGYDEGARDGFHAKFDRDGALKKSKECTACHWHEIMGAGDFQGDGRTAAEELRRARGLGADLNAYPGGGR